jgi:hypothetical protein
MIHISSSGDRASRPPASESSGRDESDRVDATGAGPALTATAGHGWAARSRAARPGPAPRTAESGRLGSKPASSVFWRSLAALLAKLAWCWLLWTLQLPLGSVPRWSESGVPAGRCRQASANTQGLQGRRPTVLELRAATPGWEKRFLSPPVVFLRIDGVVGRITTHSRH